MNEHTTSVMLSKHRRRAAALALALAAAGCGGGSGSALAVGKVGQGLSAHAASVPQGAGVCALKDGLAAQSGGPEKPLAETCGKAARSDQLYRRAIVVLAAHGETLEGIAAGREESAGRLEAARTGVKGSDWIQVDDPGEKAAREAVAKLVEQMSGAEKKDLAKSIQDAAPHVKTLCDKLNGYLDDQARAFADIQKEVEKKRVARSDRRCTTFDNRPLCLPDSSTDRVVYASTVSQLAMLEANHAAARDSVAGFCAAHVKLEEAAAGGKLDDDATYASIVDAVKAEQKGQAAAPAAAPAPAEAAPPAPAAKK